jgi:hypothetical protein
MRTKVVVRTFAEILALLRTAQFDVREGTGVAGKGMAGQTLVIKYGAGAIIAPNPKFGVKATKAMNEAAGEAVLWVHKPGWILGGHVATLVDHGYQKHFETPNLKIAATADALKAIHRFGEELREIIGEPSLYNESLGTTSDSYMYDRVKGNDLPASKRSTPAWELPQSTKLN